MRFFSEQEEVYENATQWVHHGESAIEPVSKYDIAEPTKAATEEYYYKWTGWDRDYTSIVEPSDFYPTF